METIAVDLSIVNKILIKGLKINTVVGVYDWERENQQLVIADVELCTDFSLAGRSDDVADTVDYAIVAELITKTVTEAQSKLLERLGELICERIFANFPVSEIDLTLKKPDILSDVEYVGIRIVRSRI